MAGGFNTPDMVKEVISAGGVGSFGFAYSTSELIRTHLHEVLGFRREGPVNANFFVFTDPIIPSVESQELARLRLCSLSICKDISISIPSAPYYPDLKTQLEPVWELCPQILTFHFGLPNESILREAKFRGIFVGVTVTSIADAYEAERRGADFVIAQGIEAGGHRGLFYSGGTAGDKCNPCSTPPDEQLTTMTLLRRLKGTSSSLRLPVVSAGGIMTDKDVRCFLEAGASAVQVGTAFLTALESGTPPTHRRLLLQDPTRGTALTDAYSGRIARGLRSSFAETMRGAPLLPFPLQNSLTGPMRKEAARRDDPEHQALWAGSNYAACRSASVRELMAALCSDLPSR